MTIATPENLRVVIYNDEGIWIAQCIEYDIAAQGADVPTAIRRLCATVNVESHYTTTHSGAAFAGISGAPDEFRAMFDSVETRLQSAECEAGIDFRLAA